MVFTPCVFFLSSIFWGFPPRQRHSVKRGIGEEQSIHWSQLALSSSRWFSSKSQTCKHSSHPICWSQGTAFPTHARTAIQIAFVLFSASYWEREIFASGGQTVLTLVSIVALHCGSSAHDRKYSCPALTHREKWFPLLQVIEFLIWSDRSRLSNTREPRAGLACAARRIPWYEFDRVLF